MLDIIVNPFITLLLMFYTVLGQNVFLAIVAFTVAVRLAMVPLTLAQQRSMEGMQEIQPKMKALQEKYKGDREAMYQEQMALYKEYGVNPYASCLPLMIQLPIMIGLWRAIIHTLAVSPGDLLSLSGRILIPGLDKLVPMNHRFLWLNLAVPDPYIILPVVVVITTWMQQRLMTPPPPKKKPGEDDPADQAAAMTRQMTTFMPLLSGYIALQYSSGLAVYFIISNLIGIVQYSITGKADYRRLFGRGKTDEADNDVDELGRRRKPGISDTHWIEGKNRRQVGSGASESTSSDAEQGSSRRSRKSKRKVSGAKK